MCALPSGRPASPFLQIGLIVHGKTLGAILRIRAVNIWIRLLLMRPRTGTSQSLGMVVLFLLGLLVFVRKRAGLVLRSVVGTVTPIRHVPDCCSPAATVRLRGVVCACGRVGFIVGRSSLVPSRLVEPTSVR